MSEKVDCNSCSERQIFGVRPLGTISNDGSKDKVCICNIDGKVILKEFVEWAQIHDFLRHISVDIDRLLPKSAIIARLNLESSESITLKLNRDEMLVPISEHILEIVDKLIPGGVDGLEPWEYLDVGCGSGLLSRNIASTLKTMTQHVDVRDNRLGKYGHDEFEDFHLFDGSTLPYSKNYSQIITCFLVLHHVNTPVALLKSIFTVLQPGGVFVIEEMDCRNWERAYAFDFMHHLLGEATKNDNPTVEYRSREGWRKLVTAVGFVLKRSLSKRPRGVYQTFTDVYQKPIEESAAEDP